MLLTFGGNLFKALGAHPFMNRGRLMNARDTIKLLNYVVAFPLKQFSSTETSSFAKCFFVFRSLITLVCLFWYLNYTHHEILLPRLNNGLATIEASDEKSWRRILHTHTHSEAREIFSKFSTCSICLTITKLWRRVWGRQMKINQLASRRPTFRFFFSRQRERARREWKMFN